MDFSKKSQNFGELEAASPENLTTIFQKESFGRCLIPAGFAQLIGRTDWAAGGIIV